MVYWNFVITFETKSVQPWDKLIEPVWLADHYDCTYGYD